MQQPPLISAWGFLSSGLGFCMNNTGRVLQSVLMVIVLLVRFSFLPMPSCRLSQWYIETKVSLTNWNSLSEDKTVLFHILVNVLLAWISREHHRFLRLTCYFIKHYIIIKTHFKLIWRRRMPTCAFCAPLSKFTAALLSECLLMFKTCKAFPVVMM